MAARPDPESQYDPASMGRIVVDGEDDDKLPTETDVLSRRSPLNAGGPNAILLRRGEMTPYDRRCRRLGVFLILLTAVFGASVAAGLAIRRKRNAAVHASRGYDLVPPPPDLSQKCSPLAVSTKTGWDKCEKLCAVAECCLLPEGHWFSCKANEKEDCSAYEYTCMTLDHIENLHKEDKSKQGGDKTGDKVLNQPDSTSIQAKNLCNTAAIISEESVNSCQDFCEPAMCCFHAPSSNDDESCLTMENMAWCDKYGACQGLLYSGDDGFDNHEEAKAAVSEACRTGYHECKNICDPAACCFRPDLDDSCKNGLFQLNCDHYEACETLFVPKNVSAIPEGQMVVRVPESPHNLELICISPRPDDVQRCDSFCRSAHCCNESEEVCRISEPDACDGYYGPCQEIWSGMAEEVMIPPPPMDIEEQCKTGPKSPQGSNICKEACTSATCCNEPIESCKVRNFHMCVKYEGYCDIVWNPEQAPILGPTPDWLYTTCNDDEKSPVCIEGCRESVCCGGEVSCGNMVVDENTCLDYESAGCRHAWNVLIGSGGSLDDGVERVHIPEVPPTNMEEVCNFPVDLAKCEEACRPSFCCYGGVSVCVPVNPETCDLYSGTCSDAWLKMSEMVVIPAPPDDIDLYCARDIGQSVSNRAKCREDCDAAACCNESVEECQVANPEMCDMYQKHCQPLWGDNPLEIPQPPGNLGQICSPLSLTTENGKAACEKECSKAQCCSEPIEACKATNPEICRDYSPCAGLYAESAEMFMESVMIPQPPPELAHTCSAASLSTSEGFKQCEELCAISECCNLPIEECRVLNPKTCQDYAACEVLHKKEPGKFVKVMEIPEAPADIDDLCSSNSLETVQGFTKCEDICDRARCCEVAIVGECKPNNPQACDGYDACSLLLEETGVFGNQDQQALLQLAKEVNKACEPSNLWNPQGLSHCQYMCNDRMCCFESDPEYSCVDQKECVVFAGCKSLYTYGYDSSITTPNVPIVDNLCNEDALGTVEGINACHEICSPYLCCWSSDSAENCYANQKKQCDLFEACEGIVRPVQHSHMPDDPITEEIVSFTCASSNISTDNGLTDCRALCGPHMCCFVQLGMQSNCVDTMGAECMVYSACSVLADVGDDAIVVGVDKDEPTLIGLVDDLCAEKHFANEQGRIDCVNMCSLRSCCFAMGARSCYETDKEWCDEFKACSIIDSYND